MPSPVTRSATGVWLAAGRGRSTPAVGRPAAVAGGEVGLPPQAASPTTASDRDQGKRPLRRSARRRRPRGSLRQPSHEDSLCRGIGLRHSNAPGLVARPGAYLCSMSRRGQGPTAVKFAGSGWCSRRGRAAGEVRPAVPRGWGSRPRWAGSELVAAGGRVKL